MLLLPIKMIKIDKQIVWEAFANPKVSLVLAATITMIKSLGMSVLAEGVESKIEHDILKDLDCDMIQGFLYDKPLSTQEFEKRLKIKNYNQEI